MRRAGFSLIEFLVVIATTIAISGILYSLLSGSYRTFSFETSQGQLQLSGDVALERIRRTAEQSVSVLASSNSYTTGSGTLILQIPSLDANNLVIDSTYDIIVYRFNAVNQTLTEITIPNAASSRKSTDRTLVSNLVSTLFHYYDSAGATLTSNYTNTKRIDISLEMSEEHYGRSTTVSYDQTVSLRNK